MSFLADNGINQLRSHFFCNVRSLLFLHLLRHVEATNGDLLYFGHWISRPIWCLHFARGHLQTNHGKKRWSPRVYCRHHDVEHLPSESCCCSVGWRSLSLPQHFW